MSSTTTATSHDHVLRLLHRVDPYQGFDASAHPLDLQGWNGDSRLFGDLIRRVDPQLVIEVGTWKGMSAVTMGKELQKLGVGRGLVCVDTWLGALEFWRDHDDPTRYRSLAMRHGYPSVYYQFLANVVHSGLQDVIVPFPQTSTIAARWFLERQIQADLIYVDGSHEENDVFVDLAYWWLVVRPGGVLFGDDLGWPGVRAAVSAFAAEHQLRVEVVENNFWVIQKPR